MRVVCNRSVADHATHGEVLRELIANAETEFGIVTPFITDAGVEDIFRSLQKRYTKNLFILTSFSSSAIRAGLLSLTALQKLLDPAAQVAENVYLRMICDGPEGRLHSKLYFNDDAVLVTSANLSGSAMEKNAELGMLLESDEYQRIDEEWDALWNAASPVSYDQLLALIEHSIREGLVQSRPHPESGTTFDYARTFMTQLPPAAPPVAPASRRVELPKVDVDEYRQRGERLADWLYGLEEDGRFERWRAEAARRNREKKRLFLSDPIEHPSKYTIKFDSHRWQQKIKLVSIPYEPRHGWWTEYAVEFTSEWTVPGSGEPHKVFNYPEEFREGKIFVGESGGRPERRYPYINLKDDEALDDAKTVIEWLLRHI